MGLKDSIKNARDAAKAKQADARDEAARQAERRVADRAALYPIESASCPLQIEPGDELLPGGIRLLPDEFLVAIGKDWGLSSQKLTLTTHRIIYTHGRASHDVRSVYLTDVRDIGYHKSMNWRFGTIAIDTASGRVEGLPASNKPADLRDRMMQMVHWARQRAAQPQAVHTAPAPTAEDIPAQLAKLAQLRDSGILTDDEFAASKAQLLARL